MSVSQLQPGAAQAARYAKPTDYAGLARAAGKRWGVDPDVLVGLIDVESGGNRWAVSPAGARWSTQFMPATAARYGVTADSVESQVDGAAHYLHDLGYSSSPTRALASYNAGPGNWQAGLAYARTVLARAKRYTGLGAGDASPVDGSIATGQAASDGGSEGLLQQWRDSAMHGLVWVALLGAGGALIVTGLSRSAGLRRQEASA